jgi:hypothetical protein
MKCAVRDIRPAAAALALLTVLAGCGGSRQPTATTAAVHGCEDVFSPPLVRAVACGGQLSRDFAFSSRDELHQELSRDRRTAKLFLAKPLAPGDRIVLSGLATKQTRLSLVLVDRRGRGQLVDFDGLGLAQGGRSTIVAAGTRLRPRCFILAGGETIQPARTRVRRGYRYVTALRVRRHGPTLDVSFRAVAALADVYELSVEAVKSSEGLYGVGEVEGEAIVARKTVQTQPGTAAKVTLHLRPRARFVFVQPLSRRLIELPALAAIPGR